MRTRDRNLLGRLGDALWERRHPEWANPPDGRRTPSLHLPASKAPRYLYDRLAVKVRAKLGDPGPWITEDAQTLLDQLLRPTDRGLEYGAGGTTLFFSARVRFLYSVEGFDHWYEPLAQRLAERGVENVSLYLASAQELGYESEAHREAYVGAHPELEPGSLDFVFVDGEYRDDCVLRALTLLRPGGLLVLDNAETYLPSSSRSPWRVDAPATPAWERFAEKTRDWRRVWTTNGVWDTAFWFSPGSA
jgi:predicted O-methyltransferase YrrM